uniref:Uncharacterized protein n=1 Tax=Oryza punctata TaxID=4537 RepID=A0A0E0LM67_ORYPU
MAQLSRVWVAATVAAVRAQRERAPAARERVAGLAPQAAADADGRRQAGADESLRKAMYLSCWGPS